MGFKFNPFTSNFDIIQDIAAINWMPAVATTGDLPVSGNLDGDARTVQADGSIYVWKASISRWIKQTPDLAPTGSIPNANGATIVEDDSTSNIRIHRIELEPADATHSGIISTTSQTIAGSKTFTGLTNADGGIDRSTAGTLTIGATNSTTINIGNAGATVNIQGTTIYENTPQLLTADPLITVNHGGAVGSGQNSGIQIEENSLITGYAETSLDRNSWILKAPNTAGIATITPGASGITLDQSSHNPVTLAAVGAVPNANAASLSNQVLNLQPADGTNPGVITAGTQTIGGAKTFSSTISASNLSGTNTGDVTLTVVGAVPNANGASLSGQALTLQPADGTNPGLVTAGTQTIGGNKTFSGSVTVNTLSGVVKASTGLLSTSNVSLTSEVTGTLPIANGGTNSATALNNNRIMVSNTGAIVEAAALTNGQLLIGSTGSAPAAANITGSGGITVTNGAGTINISNSIPPSTGDIAQTSFTAADNQVVAADVTGLAFANASVRAFEAIVSVTRGTTYANYKLYGVQRAADWVMDQSYVGDITGLTFTITTAGQVQYTSTSTGSTATVKFRAFVTNV